MAIITDYATLQTAVSDYLARSDLSTFIPNFIQEGEMAMYRKLRIRAMEAAFSGTISAGVIAVPADYIEMKYIYVNTSPVQFLSRVPAETIYERYPIRSGNNIPRLYSRDASNFIFGPAAGDYDLVGVYYQRLDPLSDSDATNWFTSNATDLLLYGSLCGAEMFVKNDPRFPTWKALFDERLKQVQVEDDREGLSGSSPQTIYQGAA